MHWCQLLVCVAQGHALEQGHYSKGLCGLHQETSERTAARQRAGKPSEEARTRQPPPDAQDTGQFRHIPDPNQDNSTVNM